MSEYDKKYYQEHAEEKRQARRERYRANPEREKAYAKANRKATTTKYQEKLKRIREWAEVNRTIP